MITCHLGNGCSLAAVLAGKSVETTMGFTPLDGVMMGTRSGSVDPGILIHLLHHGASADTLDRALNKESGLKGISGISEDLRQVTAAADSGNERAKLAIDVYVHRLRAYICSMLPALGGLDALVFTGGVGENSSLIRRRTCEGLEFLGVSLDLEANSGNEKDRAISAPQSKVKVLIVDTQEEWEVARECARLSS
jgi:acetate kinase